MKRVLLIVFVALTQFGQAQDLYDINTLREITIKFYEPDYHQTLIDWFNAGDGSRLAATLEMDGITYDSVAIRYKGNISFLTAEWSEMPKFPLNIDMNEYIDDQTLLGYKKLKLGNLFTDPTSVREAVAYEIYRKYTVAPKSNMIKVNIGVVGEEASYYGVYSNTESINKGFLKSHYDWKKGPLVKCDPNPADEDITCDNSGLGNGVGGEQVTAFPDLVWYGPDSCQYYSNYEMKTDFGWKELVEFIDVLNNEDSLLYDNLNIDGVLWHMAVSTVIPNIDNYYGKNIKNYYMYKHKDSLWHVIPWDVNESFGGVMGNNHANWDVLRWFDPDEPNRPLIWQILKHDRYYKQYFAHIRTVIEENQSEANIRSQVDSIQNLIEQAVIDGPYKRFPDEGFRGNVDYDVTYSDLAPLSYYKAIIPTVNERLNYLNDHPEIMKIPPTLINTIRNIEVPEEGQEVWVTAEVTNATQVDLMITTNRAYASYFEPFEMKDDGLSNDGAAGDGVYGALVPFQSLDEEIKYYVRAQNAEAMILEPRRAEYEFFEYTIAPTGSGLPIVLQNFTGKNIEDKGNLLSWTMEDEDPGLSFAIQRYSKKTETWKTIGSQEADFSLQYEMLDVVPEYGSNLYRLKMLQYGDLKYYSEILDIRVLQGLPIIEVSPNPVNDLLNMKITSTTEMNLEVQILDLTGRIVRSTNIGLTEGTLSYTFDFSDLVSGIYFFKTGELIEKLIKR